MKFEILEDRRMMATDIDPVPDRMVDVRNNYGQTVEVGTRGDFDKSGFVDFKDFLLVANDLRTFYVPVKWSIPDQGPFLRGNEINKVLNDGIAKLSISITNKNGTFGSTCDVLLGDLKTSNTKCTIIADSTNLLATDEPWTITVGFKRQNISPIVSIKTVNIERLIDPKILLNVQSRFVQLGVTDFRGISIRRPIPFISP